VKKGLYEQMSMTWDDTIRHALLMNEFGFSILEKVWERRDNLIMPKKLDPRLPMSIWRWNFDGPNKSLIGPEQIDSDGTLYPLPIEKLLVFTNEREGDNWEGFSVLRPAYKPWFIKDQLEKINAIKHDRHGVGVPVGGVPANVKPGSQEWIDTVNALEALYAQEQSYLIQPEGYTFSVLGSGGDQAGTDVLPSIKYYDECIARSMLAMFLNLGTSQTGSRALGSSFIDVFLQSLQAMAGYIADVLNRFLIKEWVGYNWGDADLPTLVAGRIEPIDIPGLAQAVASKLITVDIELENVLRSQLALPEKEEETIDEQATPGSDEGNADEPPLDKSQQDQAQQDQGNQDPPLDSKQGTVAASERIRGHVLQMAEPSEIERLCDLSGMELRLNQGQASLASQLKQIRDTQAADLAMQLVGGRAVQNLRVVQKKDMYDLMVATFKQSKKSGVNDIQSEMKNQRPDLKFAEMRTRMLANPTKKKLKAVDAEKFATESISLNVEGQANKLASAMARYTLDLKQSGLQGDALKTALMSRYDKMPTSDLDRVAAGAVNKGWGVGRLQGLEAVADETDHCYYSPILDQRLCQNCLSTSMMPGAQSHEVDDPDFATPNPDCLGGDLCRCFTIAVMKAESAVDQSRAGQFGGAGSGRYPAGSGGAKASSVVEKIKGSNEFPSPAIAGTHDFQQDELFTENASLTDIQKEAISVYRSNDYMSINAGLRGEVPLEGVQGVNEAIAELDNAFKNAPTLDTPAVLYRGGNFDKDQIAAMQPGAEIEDKAFLSTSASSHVSSSFAGGDSNMGTTGVQFEIVAPAGARYLMLSPAEEGSEAEVLFARGSRLQVLSTGSEYADGTGDMIVRAALIGAGD
jgi:hypothetical protein